MADTAAAAPGDREPTGVALERERRARRRFSLLVLAFALLAVGGGIFAAWTVLWDAPKDKTPTPAAAKPPPPIQEFGPLQEFDDPEKAPVVTHTKPTKKLRDTLDDGSIRRGLAKLQPAFNACARTHGALDDSVVRLEFDIAPGGRVSAGSSRPPHTSTPLGLCIATVLKTRGKFAKSRTGRAHVKRSLTLHP